MVRSALAGASNSTITWQLTAQYQTLKPAPHRIPDLPRYPVYWYSETIARLLPPTSTSGNTVWGAYDQWQYNTPGGSIVDPGWHQLNVADNPAKGMAYGWWIYSVSINRTSGASGTVAVSIGCMRSGSFVSFGTYNTGQTIQVLWPIFTSDALVYQCTERVDIQALAIASGNTVGMGETISKPMCAAFIADTSALMGLIT